MFIWAFCCLCGFVVLGFLLSNIALLLFQSFRGWLPNHIGVNHLASVEVFVFMKASAGMFLCMMLIIFSKDNLCKVRDLLEKDLSFNLLANHNFSSIRNDYDCTSFREILMFYLKAKLEATRRALALTSELRFSYFRVLLAGFGAVLLFLTKDTFLCCALAILSMLLLWFELPTAFFCLLCTLSFGAALLGGCASNG